MGGKLVFGKKRSTNFDFFFADFAIPGESNARLLAFEPVRSPDRPQGQKDSVQSDEHHSELKGTFAATKKSNQKKTVKFEDVCRCCFSGQKVLNTTTYVSAKGSKAVDFVS
jgi:hypothetical protein